MLPEAISNGLCSLKPDVDRLCMVSEIDISARGKVTRHQFYEAVMHSHARLTYNEVAEALGLTEKSPRAGLMKRLQGLMPELENLNSLYQCLRAERSKRGAIDFETTETKIIFNADRKIETIAPVFRNDAHKIIEECMLCANVAAANFLASQEKPVLYRVHEGPKEQKLDNLRLYLGELGLSLSGGLKPSPNDYQVLMQAIEGRPDAHLIQIMMLRSLSQAVYQPDNEGHFGLAYPAYLHFTSPIRRYPDLLVHRAIRSVIRSRKNDDQVRKVPGAKPIAKKHIYPYEMTDIVAAGIHTSMAERRADDATRDVTAWLK
jgi:ribonuclease R